MERGWNDYECGKDKRGGSRHSRATGTHTGEWHGFLKRCGEAASAAEPFQSSGTLTRVTGLVMEAMGLKLAVGSGCTVIMPNGDRVEAEVVGFNGDRLYLMPTTDVFGLTPGAKVIPWEQCRNSACAGGNVPTTPSRIRPGQALSGGSRIAGAGTGWRGMPVGRARAVEGGAGRPACE